MVMMIKRSIRKCLSGWGLVVKYIKEQSGVVFNVKAWCIIKKQNYDRSEVGASGECLY